MSEPAAPRQDTDARRRRTVVPAMQKAPTSGGRGLAILLGAMVGIIGLLWLLAWLVAPH